ncbi:hypothetical protein BAY06_12840 [Elizabethkingia anophelis]|uniref:HEPN family nuclease n=1 Tax=Elizabethkingia anophelis TaxID=1117645 RepID=UPI000999DCF2|nr:HEPN family nuclease [Elizabethkingia anophelis]OPC54600.1 hypothetical protein BAY06_12840 [Elizabethkingia anophelis]
MEYKNFDIDFIERTLSIIQQYDELHLDNRKYEVTLMINSLLGIIVFPKEKNISYIPNDKINESLNESIGLTQSDINPKIKTVKELINKLRNSISHFDFETKSNTITSEIEKIIFYDKNIYVADFHIKELKLFIEYIASNTINNIKLYK